MRNAHIVRYCYNLNAFPSQKKREFSRRYARVGILRFSIIICFNLIILRIIIVYSEDFMFLSISHQFNAQCAYCQILL